MPSSGDPSPAALACPAVEAVQGDPAGASARAAEQAGAGAGADVHGGVASGAGAGHAGGTLRPREHGAWAQLGATQLTAMAAGGAACAASWCWTIAVAAAFVAHEPMLVLFGQRGARARRQLGAAAARRLALLGVVAALGLAASAALGGRSLIVAALVPLALGVAAVALAWRGLEKTLVGEVLVGLALAAAAMPPLVAAGWSERAVTASVAWAVALTIATVAVRAVVAQQRASRVVAGRWAAGALAAAALAGGALAACLGIAPWAAALAPAPVAGAGLVLAVRPPPARSLRRVGWSLAVCFVACTAMLVTGLLA